MSFAMDLVILGVAATHVLLAPFTKVEESFNLHALHDIITYGVTPEGLSKYDHFVFSGAVPRSFIGSLFVASTVWPFSRLSDELSRDNFQLQIILRLCLASYNALALCALRRAVQRRFGRLTALLFTLFTITQFHLFFWMGRTVPNMFALIPVTLAFRSFIHREKNAVRATKWQVTWALSLLIFTGVVLRAEVAGLVIVFALQSLLEGSIPLFDLVKVGLLSSLVSLAMTVLVDSYFWDQWPLWPEFASLFFNVVEGKSADWGVSPPHTYFTSFLPKLLLGALPLSIIGAVIDARVRSFIVPSLAFIALLSAIGHKEWRFIAYVVPLFNIAAARGARALVTMRKGTFLGRLAFLAVAGLIALNAAFTVLATYSSMLNYPGGAAIAQFNKLYASVPDVHVHICNLAAQTGASLFTHVHERAGWTYNKTENLTPAQLRAGPFTHLLAEDPAEFAGVEWEVRAVVHAFDGWDLERDVSGLVEREGVRGLLSVLRPRTAEKVWIVERHG